MKIGIVQVALSHGGAERVGVMLANGFHQHGHQVFILTDLNERIDYQVDDDIRIFDFVDKNTNVFMKWIKAVKNIRKNVKKEKPDVLIGIMGLCTLVSYIACLGLHVPIVMTEHNSFERPESAPMSFTQRVFKFWINRLYKHITVLTEADKLYIGNRLKNVAVMPNPLALTPITFVPNKEKVVLAAGRVDSWHYKGFDVLIRAWARVVASSSRSEAADAAFKEPDGRSKAASCVQGSSSLRCEAAEGLQESSAWRLQIAGTGSEKSFAYLKQLCKENGVEDSVDFLGYRSDIQDLFKQANVFVLSSRYEGFGLVLIEAMSQGCACIACDYKGRQREIMGLTPCPSPVERGESPTQALPHREENPMEVYENGILCEPDNVEALASAMEKMIEDEEYRRRAQENAVVRSRFYSLDNIINRWEVYLNQVVNSIM